MKNFKQNPDRILESRYRIDRKIASGSMSVVYQATLIKLNRPVAIKFLHPSLCHNDQFLKRFELELKAMSRLSHPNCVSLLDFGITVTDTPYLVMELVQGQTLAQVMKLGPVEPKRALRIVRDVLAGLTHIHKHGILHRDIKPKNTMITQADCFGDHVRILDFGLANYFRESGETLTGKGNFAGTLQYLAPESICCDDEKRILDERTDVFGVGIVAYQMLTGVRPYFAKTLGDVFGMHDRIPSTLLEAYSDGSFSSQLEKTIAKAIAKNPDDRYQDAEAFVAAVDREINAQRQKDMVRFGLIDVPASKLSGMVSSLQQNHLRKLGDRLSILCKNISRILCVIESSLRKIQSSRFGNTLSSLAGNQQRKLNGVVPVLYKVIKRFFRRPRSWNTILLIAIIALQIWNLARTGQRDHNIHSGHPGPQPQQADYSIDPSISNANWMNAGLKLSQTTTNDELQCVEVRKNRQVDTPEPDEIDKQSLTQSGISADKTRKSIKERGTILRSF